MREVSEINAPFQQCLDSSRPHTLLTPQDSGLGTLEYRYDDTQERVRVPSIWYNQPFTWRVGFVRFQAQQAEDMAAKLEKHPPLHASDQAVKEAVARFRARAAKIRSEADRMQSAGLATHPVAASLMQLDYGPNVMF